MVWRRYQKNNWIFPGLMRPRNRKKQCFFSSAVRGRASPWSRWLNNISNEISHEGRDIGPVYIDPLDLLMRRDRRTWGMWSTPWKRHPRRVIDPTKGEAWDHRDVWNRFSFLPPSSHGLESLSCEAPLISKKSKSRQTCVLHALQCELTTLFLYEYQPLDGIFHKMTIPWSW